MYLYKKHIVVCYHEYFEITKQDKLRVEEAL